MIMENEKQIEPRSEIKKAVFITITVLVFIALTDMWTAHKFGDANAITFLAIFTLLCASIGYHLPKLPKIWSTGILDAGLVTIYRDKHPCIFYMNFGGMVLVVLVILCVAVWSYLAIFLS
jgi:hypothetical protein